MINEENRAAIITEKLGSNEELIAKLYCEYATAFPELKAFWDSLAADEVIHASWLRSLGSMTHTKEIFIDEKRFNTAAIQSYMDYLDKEIARIKNQGIPLIEALSITFYIEESLIEKRFFEVFLTDSVKVKNTLDKLNNETKAHRNKTKEILEKYKK